MIKLFAEQVLWEENYNLKDIVTPVDAEHFNELMLQAGYPEKDRIYLHHGFKYGFSVGYEGSREIVQNARNLKLRVGSKTELWNKVMKEVGAGRYAGPFEGQPPFKYYIQSPIGLVPKDGGKKTHLIFHLSHPRDTRKGVSVNGNIPKDFSRVVYPEFCEAIRMCINEGINAKIGKSDMSMAFRHIPLMVGDYMLMVLKAEHPITGITYFFVDKCLPFGCSSSCKIFQSVSNAIAYLVSWRTKKPTLNYLDDYFFAAMLKTMCNWQMKIFLKICKEIRFPVALEKTYWGTEVLTFLGFLIDTVNQRVCIPVEKVTRALELIEYFLHKKSKKVTVHEVQKLCGFLNFLCRCLIPGKAFTRRLYSMTAGTNGVVLQLHHHIKIREEN